MANLEHKHIETRFKDLHKYLDEKFDNQKQQVNDFKNEVGELSRAVAELKEFKSEADGALRTVSILWKAASGVVIIGIVFVAKLYFTFDYVVQDSVNVYMDRNAIVIYSEEDEDLE